MYLLEAFIKTAYITFLNLDMDFNIQVRKKQLLNLEQYIFTSKDKVHSILDCLGWNVREILKEKPLVSCPIDSSHKVSTKNINSHIENCVIKSEGYNLNEDFLSEPLHDAQASVVIGDKKLEIFNEACKQNPYFKKGWNGLDRDPRTSDRLTTTYSSDERLALYEYVVSHTKGPSPPPEFNINTPIVASGNGPLTEEEFLRQSRDAKRRRIKYKAVHTNKKSYMEVLREVINSQMEGYQEWLQENCRNCELNTKQERYDEESISTENYKNKVIQDNNLIDANLREHSQTDYRYSNSHTSRGSNYSDSSRSSKQTKRSYYRESKSRREGYKEDEERKVTCDRNLRDNLSNGNEWEKRHHHKNHKERKSSEGGKYKEHDDELYYKKYGKNRSSYDKYKRHKEYLDRDYYEHRYEKYHRSRERSRSKTRDRHLSSHRQRRRS